MMHHVTICPVTGVHFKSHGTILNKNKTIENNLIQINVMSKKKHTVSLSTKLFP
jgi:CobQ-like glutamine amidotransferase family enzyme